MRVTFRERIAARPIAAKRLHRCRLRFNDGTQWRASVFPFFERGGEVRALVVVRYDVPGVHAVPHRADWIEHASPWSVKHVRAASTDLSPLTTGGTLDELVKLWHYDPWWVLRGSSFADHVASHALQDTNCVGRLPMEARSLAFDPDLSRVHSIELREGNLAETQLWDSVCLPERRDPATDATMPSIRSRWVLDPIWMRSGRGR